MAQYCKSFSLVLVLSLAVERGDSFSPRRSSQLRYPTSSNDNHAVLASSYLDNLTPREEEDSSTTYSSSWKQESLEDSLASQQEALENHNRGADSYLNNLSVSGYQGSQQQQQQDTFGYPEHSVEADQASSPGSSWAPINPKGKSRDRSPEANDPVSVSPPSAWSNTNDFIRNGAAAQQNNMAAPGDHANHWNPVSSWNNGVSGDSTMPTKVEETNTQPNDWNQFSYLSNNAVGASNEEEAPAEPTSFGESLGMSSFAASDLGQESFVNNGATAPESATFSEPQGMGSYSTSLGQDSTSGGDSGYVETAAPESTWSTSGDSSETASEATTSFSSPFDTVSFADSLRQDSSANDLNNGETAPPESTSLEAPLGTDSTADRSDESHAYGARNGETAPESTSNSASFERNSFPNGQDSVVEDDAKSDDIAPELSGFAAGLSSFADSLTQSTFKDSVESMEAVSFPSNVSTNAENDDSPEPLVHSQTPEMFAVQEESLTDTPPIDDNQIDGGSSDERYEELPEPKSKDVAASSGWGSFAESLKARNAPARNDNAVSASWSQGTGSFADTGSRASSSSGVNNDNDDDTTLAGNVPSSGIGSFADSLKSSPSRSEVSDTNTAEPGSESFEAVPGMGSFADSLKRSSSADDSSEDRNDDSEPKGGGGIPGLGSFADSLKSRSSSVGTNRKEWGGGAAHGIGSFTDKLRGPSAADDISSPTKRDVEERKAAAPGMSSFLDRLGNDKEDRPTTNSNQPSHASSEVKGDVTYVPPTAKEDALSDDSFARRSARHSRVTDTSIPSMESTVETTKDTPPVVDTTNSKKKSLAAKSDKAVAVAMDAFRNNMVGANKGATRNKKQDAGPRSASVSMRKTQAVNPATSSPPSGQVSMVRKERAPKNDSQQDDDNDSSALIGRDDLTLEERIATSISDARAIGLNKKTYESTRENLRDFKFRTQRRLNVSESEKEKAAEKLASIASRLEAETRAVRDRLDSKLAESQMNSDKEISRIKDLLAAEINLEVEREKNMVQFMDSLKELIASKKNDIANDEKITREMTEARMKLREGAIADNLDIEVEQRLSIAVIEKELVKVLSECLVDLRALSEDARTRAARTKATLEKLNRPDTRSSKPYDWSDIEEMEQVLEQAAVNVAKAEKRIRELSQRIDDALVNRAVVLGEDVPPGLAKTAQRAAARSIKKASTSPDFEFGLDSENFVELKSKDETELMAIFAKSIGSAAFDGSKAAVFGLKAVLDTVTGQPAVDAANQIAYEVKKDSDESKKSSALVESKDNAFMVVESVKSTASVLGSVGKAGSTIVKGIGESDSAHVAGEALKDTTKDLFTSLETAAALGTKLYLLAVKGIEGTLAGEHELPRIPWADGMKRLPSMSDMHPLEDVKEMVRQQSNKNRRLKP